MAAIEEFITLTTAAPAKKIAMDGPHRVDIVGTFGSGTVTEYSSTIKGGRGEALVAASAARSYISESPSSDFEIAGSTGATVDIVLTSIINKTLGG